jgi:streptogramin lyase
LDRIDPKSMKIEAHIPLVPATDEGYIAAGSHGVWVAGSVGLSRAGLVRVNPQTNHVVTRIPMPGTPAAVAASFDAVWVTLPDQGMVVRVNPSSNKVVARIKVHPGPRFLATGEDAVWVLSQSDGSVARIDPSTNRVAATIRANVPGEGGCIAAGEGSVWVTMPQTPVIRIDPGDNRVAERYTGAGGDCISAGLGSVWLSNHDFGDIWRIKP